MLASEKAVEELKRQLQPKGARTCDDAGDAHEMIAEVDNWDLSVHRREVTRVQNPGRRNVTLGSLHDQPKPRTGKDSRVDQISWCQTVRVLGRPLGQKTSSQSQQQGSGTVRQGYRRLL